MAGENGIHEPLTGEHEKRYSLREGFSSSSSFLLVVLLVLFAVLVEYPTSAASDLHVGQYYMW